MTPDSSGGRIAGSRIGRIVGTVCTEAVRASGATGVVVLDDWTPEGELAYEWLVAALGEDRVWRAASHGDNVDGRALLAHPVNRTALLLGGRPPLADLLPLGDVGASHVEALSGSCSAPDSVRELARAAGGPGPLDTALARLLEERRPASEALAGLDPDVARRLLDCLDAGRWFRLYPRLVPKLGFRTLGIDLFD
jgi:hypothetical protein